MPFDNLGYVETAVCFADLNLIPISEQRVKQWRDFVVDSFAKGGSRQRVAVLTKQARWLVKDPIEVGRFGIHDYASSPKDVRRLVARIAKALPDATCSVHWFYTDPILYIEHDGKSHCVAIWDKGIVRAIAGNATLCPTQHVLRNFVATV